MSKSANRKVKDVGEVIPNARRQRKASRSSTLEQWSRSSTNKLKTLWPEPDWHALSAKVDKWVLVRFYLLYRQLGSAPLIPPKSLRARTTLSVKEFETAYKRVITYLNNAMSKVTTQEDFAQVEEDFFVRYTAGMGENDGLYQHAAGTFSGKQIAKNLRHPFYLSPKNIFLLELLQELDFPGKVIPWKIKLFPMEIPKGEEGNTCFRLCQLNQKSYSYSERNALYINEFPDRKTAVAALIQYHGHEFSRDVPAPSNSTGRVVRSLAPDGTTAEKLMHDFGLRGIQFGASLSDRNRLIAITNTYRAFDVVSRMLEIPKPWIGGGKLGFAFAARGVGGGSAHYESKEHVINLSKNRGPGSIAHELFHSFDRRMGKAFVNQPVMFSEWLEKEEHQLSEIPAIHQVRASAFDAILQACYQAQTFQAAAQSADDRSSSPRYWSRPSELLARAFEAWCQDTLETLGISADWLAFRTRDNALGLYPSGDERKTINACFDEHATYLFNANKTGST